MTISLLPCHHRDALSRLCTLGWTDWRGCACTTSATDLDRRRTVESTFRSSSEGPTPRGYPSAGTGRYRHAARPLIRWTGLVEQPIRVHPCLRRVCAHRPATPAAAGTLGSLRRGGACYCAAGLAPARCRESSAIPIRGTRCYDPAPSLARGASLDYLKVEVTDDS